MSRHLNWSTPQTATFLPPTLACSSASIFCFGYWHRQSFTHMCKAEIAESSLTLLRNQVSWSLYLLDFLSQTCVLHKLPIHPCHCQNSGSPLDDQTSRSTGFLISRLSMLVWKGTWALGSQKSVFPNLVPHFSLSISATDVTTYSNFLFF